MADREKVIKGLEACIPNAIIAPACYEYGQLMRDALALLKEQEPKQIVRKQGKRENSDGSIEYFAEWYCPHCGKLLTCGYGIPWIDYCYKCGQAVLWNAAD